MTTQLDLQVLAWQVAQAKVPCPSAEVAMAIDIGKLRNYPALPFCESHCQCEHHKPWRCQVCAGTGEVLRFPEMSQECSCTSYMENHCFSCGFVRDAAEPSGWRFYHAEDCENCHGTGRVPIAPDAGKLIDAMAKDGFAFLGIRSPNSHFRVRFSNSKPLLLTTEEATGEDFNTTVYEAAVKAMEASNAN